MTHEEVHAVVRDVPLSDLAAYLRAHGYAVKKVVTWEYFTLHEDTGLVRYRDETPAEAFAREQAAKEQAA